MTVNRSGTAAVLTAVLCVLGTYEALAGGRGGSGSQEPEPSGQSYGKNLMSRVVFKAEGGSAKAGDTGSLTPAAVDWKPPACWYEPYWKAKDFKTFVEAQWSIYESVGGDAAGMAGDKEHYKGGKPYKDFNVDKNDKGMWWVGVKNPDMEGDPATGACERKTFWVDNGEPANAPQAIGPKILAALAYQQTRVPDTEVELKPEAKSTVNLPTWAWLDKGTFKDVEVRAELPGTGLWAQTTAKPASLHMEPGTGDAETYPASGECEFNEDGSIGTPYTRGASQHEPPCGIKYLRATSGQPYQLTASVTWEIEWTGTGGAKGNLPDGTFETTQAMNVQEIQSINR
ncbi:hypothetical protein [Streptomyces sp. BA2]|uniref:hypothetical protein n=1 Tax=Streptomyces sp. BA2 TaxID=436595 RepID=UPI003015694C